MKRYWIKRAMDDEEVVETYFDNEPKARAVADALERETGNSYYVDTVP